MARARRACLAGTPVRGGAHRAPSSDRPLQADAFTWALDATGGVALRIAALGNRRQPSAQLWFLCEAGYGFSGDAEMAFTPELEPGESRRFGTTRLPDLRPSGATNRAALALTF